MKFKSSLFTCTIFVSMFMSSCKYEDGPGISLRSAENRIAGTYDITKFTIGGYDSLTVLKSKPCYARITFDTGDIYGNRDNINCGIEGTYGLSDGNRKINFSLSGHFPVMPPLGYGSFENVTWEISELRDDEMTFKTEYNGLECVLELKE